MEQSTAGSSQRSRHAATDSAQCRWPVQREPLHPKEANTCAAFPTASRRRRLAAIPFPAINRQRCSRIVLVGVAPRNVDQTRPHNRRSRALPRSAKSRLQRLRRVAHPVRARSRAGFRLGSAQPCGSKIEMLSLRHEGSETDSFVTRLTAVRGCSK